MKLFNLMGILKHTLFHKILNHAHIVPKIAYKILFNIIEKRIMRWEEKSSYYVISQQNCWDAAKAAIRGKSLSLQAYLKKQEKSQVNNLTLHLKELGKKPKRSRRKEIIKIRA